MAQVTPPTGELADASTRTSLDTGRHDLPVSAALDAFLRQGWALPETADAGRSDLAALCADRRDRLSQHLPRERIVVPAGQPALRGNGQEHRFRAGSDYVYLTGDESPGGALVLEPEGGGHRATLFLRPPSDSSTTDFFQDYHHGELWVGRRPALAQVEAALGLDCRPLTELGTALARTASTRLRRGLDPDIDALVAADDAYPEGELRALLSELRLVKVAWEVAQIEQAVEATIRGFADVVRVLPAAVAGGGERQVEGAFVARARVDGNGVAFNPIAAAGSHATILHWRQNDGAVRPGELLLLDAGVETRTLYAADLTRTLPVDGVFTPVQRRMLELVNAAQDAGLEAIRPGAPFRDFHRAIATVMAEGLADWGLLPVSATESVLEDSGLYRRYTLCAPGHMLGLDIHDCADARAASYLDGVLLPGNVLTVEPGLYFQPDDATLPEELRGIGVRVEDDVVVTETGCRVLSARLPRQPDEVEAWMANLRSE